MSLVIPNLYIGSKIELENESVPLTPGDLNINAASNYFHYNAPPGVIQLNLPWEDNFYQKLNENEILFNIVKFMDSFLERNKKVFVNCYAGVSRSASIVIAYLMYKKNISFIQAFEFLKMKRSIVSPNLSFIDQLSSLETPLQDLNPHNKKKFVNNNLKSIRNVSTYFY
jgi:protein-tyrosine phosphatase